MARIGAHVSIAGGIDRSVQRGLDLECETIQIFSKNQRQWTSKPLDPAEVESFRSQLDRSGIRPVVIHDSYLINLGGPKEDMFVRSTEAFSDELFRASVLQAPFLVMHPGSHLGEGEEYGIGRIAEGLDRSWELYEKKKEDEGEGEPDTTVLIETTAGQGTGLGYAFEQIADIIERSSIGEHLAVCYDTCHTFAAGYDISKPEGYGKTFEMFDSVLGLDMLKVFHLNDSKKGAGSRVDRHENIGKGEIGLDAFVRLVNDPAFRDTPMILETPGGDEWYSANLQLLRDKIN